MNAASAMPLEIADLAFRLSEETLSASEALPLYDWVAKSAEHRAAFSELLLLFSHLEWERCSSKLAPIASNFAAETSGEKDPESSQQNCFATLPTCTAAGAELPIGSAASRVMRPRASAIHRKSLRVKAALTLGVGAIYYGFWIILFWGIGHGNELANRRSDSETSLALVPWHDTVAQFHQANGRPLALAATLRLEPGSKGRTTFGFTSGKGQSAPEHSLDDPTESAHRLYSGQSVELTAGRATVQFNSGAQIDLVAPATMEIGHDNAAILQHGRLLATVPPQASGFVLDTRSLHIVDLGTEFGVAAPPNGQDEVHVFLGEVQVSRCNDNSDDIPPTTLRAGQSVVIDSGSAQLIEQSASPEAFADISTSATPSHPQDKSAHDSASVKLLGLYTLDGDAQDSGSGKQHATAVSNVHFAAGYENQAAYFDGTPDSYIDLPIDASAEACPELTMGAWVRPSKPIDRRMEILSIDNLGYDRVLTLDNRRGGYFAGDPQFSAFAGPNVGVVRSSGPLPSTDRWTFVAATYRQELGLVMLYVEDPKLRNGQGGLHTELAGNATIGPSHRTLRIGNHHNRSEPFFGAIDNVFVFRGALRHLDLEQIRRDGANQILKWSHPTATLPQPK